MKLAIEESVLRQALNYLETAAFRDSDRDEAITALRSALDAAEKVEPVAWWDKEKGDAIPNKYITDYGKQTCIPVYLHPATDELARLRKELADLESSIAPWRELQAENKRLSKIEAAAVKALGQQWSGDEWYDDMCALDAALKEG